MFLREGRQEPAFNQSGNLYRDNIPLMPYGWFWSDSFPSAAVPEVSHLCEME